VPRLPESIDKYKIENLIATGGMGAVYKGIHPTLERSIILKKLTLRGNASIAERFRREAKILIDFRNDFIVDVYDHFKQGGSHYMVMEYVDGVSVQDLIEDHRYLDNTSAAYITLQTAKALSYAHSKEVVHRDIKPANVLISRSGEVKLADFGIASYREDTDQNLTTEGMTLGTPSYMAPEQFENTRTVDGRADIYSLGVMLYEMVTGKKPFPGGFTPELVKKIQQGKFTLPKRFNPSVASDLQRLIRKLMKPKLKHRISRWDKIIALLERYLQRYPEEKIQENLVRLVNGDDALPIKRQKPKGRRNLVLPLILGLLTIGPVALYAGITHVHRRIFTPSGFGEIQIQIDLGAGRDVTSEDLETERQMNLNDLRIQTQFFIDDNAEIPEIEAPLVLLPHRVFFAQNQVQTELNFSSGANSLLSLPRVLAVGDYRLKTVINDRVYWTSFNLPSWESYGKAFKLSIQYDLETSYPLEFSYSVQDSDTGADLQNQVQVYWWDGFNFVPYTRDLALFSGQVHRFRLIAAGYRRQDFSFSVLPEQRSLTLNAALAPLY
jgi:serine/threonine protein kinase